jgi:AcrR family transcriptional regulator
MKPIMINDENPECSRARRERCDAIENRRQILAAARELFAGSGVDATSMQEIALRAGVGKGTLYRHFAHKGEVCHTLLKDDIAAFQDQIAATLHGPAAPPTALAKLASFLDQLLTLVEGHVPLLAAVQEAAAGPRRDDAYQNTFYCWLFAQIRALLAEAVAAGETGDLDLDVTADAILAALAPPLIGFQQQQRGFSRARIAAGVNRLFIAGLRTTSAGGSI